MTREVERGWEERRGGRVTQPRRETHGASWMRLQREVSTPVTDRFDQLLYGPELNRTGLVVQSGSQTERGREREVEGEGKTGICPMV